ncbi:MAG TPA: hypothetical protein PKH77_18200 [Anaerolineae bacterium]|nr:hypothetical protein [Anaerolineae bacterium]
MNDVAPRKMPVISRRIEIAEGPYAGWWAEMQVNPPQRVISELIKGDTDLSSVSGLIVEWNFVDFEGQPLDPKAPLEELPYDLMRALLPKYLYEVFHPFWLNGAGGDH